MVKRGVSDDCNSVVIDGAEAQPSAIRGAKLFEVVSHITLTEHIFLMSGLVVSDKWLQSLPEAHRKIVVAEAKKSGAAALKANVEQADQIFTEIKAKGVKVTAVDKTPFRNAVQPVYDERYLSATPQERLYRHGRCPEGLLPQPGVSAAERHQFQQFGELMEDFTLRRDALARRGIALSLIHISEPTRPD